MCTLNSTKNRKVMGVEIWNAKKSGLIKQVAKAVT